MARTYRTEAERIRADERWLDVFVWRASGQIERLLTMETWQARTTGNREAEKRRLEVQRLLAGDIPFGIEARRVPAQAPPSEELAALIAEQERDARTYRIAHPWEVSLDSSLPFSGYTFHDVLAA